MLRRANDCRIDSGKNFVQRQSNIPSVTVGSNRKELRRGLAERTEGDSYRAGRQLSENALQRNGHSRSTNVQVTNALFQIRRKAPKNRRERVRDLDIRGATMT